MKKNRLLAFSLALIMCIIMLFNICSVSAIENVDVSETIIEAAYSELVSNIEYKYGDIYSFDNFTYHVSAIKETDSGLQIDINIIVDMMLTRHPSESVYIKAMYAAASNIEDVNLAAVVDAQIYNFANEISELYYMKPEASVFKYTIFVPRTFTYAVNENNANAYQLCYRTDISANEAIITPIQNFEKIENNTATISSNAAMVINKMCAQSANNVVSLSSNVTYDRLEARQYALDHGTDVPEFSASNGQGSDCANFVSKCLNAGGIPEDTTGKWYRSSNGTTSTCGINWMRTGYYDNGGVVPYMVNKGYFYEQADESMVFAGSIMYWNNASHVALVTSGDTVTIKYTQHSNIQLEEDEAINIVYEDENATFYMPYSSIMANS